MRIQSATPPPLLLAPGVIVGPTCKHGRGVVLGIHTRSGRGRRHCHDPDRGVRCVLACMQDKEDELDETAEENLRKYVVSIGVEQDLHPVLCCPSDEPRCTPGVQILS